jgi:GT2 family glycosyltransferase
VPLLESLLALDGPEFEVIVVDQSAGDETCEAVRRYLDDGRFSYVRTATTGLSRARNIGAAQSRAPFLLITDDDCTVPPNWVEAMLRPFADARVGVVFCTVEPVPVTELGVTPAVVFPANRVLRRPADAWRASWQGLSLGAGMGIRRATFDELGGFDELLGAGARFGSSEDNDFSWRAIRRGWYTYQLADVSVLHDGFRALHEVRALVQRDLNGVGGAISKYVRVGELRILGLLGAWIVRFGIIGPGQDVLGGRKPRGFKRPYLLLRGLYEGLRTPIDRRQLVFEPNSAREI